MDCENSFTREELEDMLAPFEAPIVSTGTVRELVRSLLAEMDKPKVWDGAPGYSAIATVVFSKNTHDTATIWSKLYRRDLPKSRAREIAEEVSGDTPHAHPLINGNRAVDVIEAAILKREAELKEGKE